MLSYILYELLKTKILEENKPITATSHTTAHNQGCKSYHSFFNIRPKS